MSVKADMILIKGVLTNGKKNGICDITARLRKD